MCSESLVWSVLISSMPAPDSRVWLTRRFRPCPRRIHGHFPAENGHSLSLLTFTFSNQQIGHDRRAGRVHLVALPGFFSFPVGDTSSIKQRHDSLRDND